MQIRYRITFAYSLTVAIVLFLVCSSIYYFARKNGINDFRDRLESRAISTKNLFWNYAERPSVLLDIFSTSPGALEQKSILIFNQNFQKIFFYNDPHTDTFRVSDHLFSALARQSKIFFSKGLRDGVAIRTMRGGKSYYIIVVAFDNDRAAWLPRLRLVLTISFIGALIIVLCLGYSFSTQIVKSLSQLTGSINKISSSDFTRRLSTGKHKDELHHLADTINQLLDRLEKSFSTQRSFIDNASHELLTPLTSVTSQIEVALQRERTNEEYRKVLHSTHEDLIRLALLVKNLLEIAKTSGSVKGLELLPVRVDELLLRLPAAVMRIQDRYHVRLHFDASAEEAEDIIVFGNEEMLFAAIKNIVMNACKYSSDGVATVRLNTNGNSIIINIEDQGDGIKPEEQEMIFQPFYRSLDVNENIKGSGLGLPLARQIIRLHGGEISLSSQPGEGTIFTIHLTRMPDK